MLKLLEETIMHTQRDLVIPSVLRRFLCVSLLTNILACSNATTDQSQVFQSISSADVDRLLTAPDLTEQEWAKVDNTPISKFQAKLLISVPQGSTVSIGGQTYQNYDQIAQNWNATVVTMAKKFKNIGELRKAAKAHTALLLDNVTTNVGMDLRGGLQLSAAPNEQQNCKNAPPSEGMILKAVSEIVRTNDLSRTGTMVYSVSLKEGNGQYRLGFQVYTCQGNKTGIHTSLEKAEQTAKEMQCQEADGARNPTEASKCAEKYTVADSSSKP